MLFVSESFVIDVNVQQNEKVNKEKIQIKTFIVETIRSCKKEEQTFWAKEKALKKSSSWFFFLFEEERKN